MRTLTRLGVMAVAGAALTVAGSSAAYAAASLSQPGTATIESRRTLSVPITATCDDVGQETTFIVVSVTQGDYQDRKYVEGQGDVLEVTCDSTAHDYTVSVPVTFGRGGFRPGTATLDAIISDCYTVDGTLSCTTQAFIPDTTITLTRG